MTKKPQKSILSNSTKFQLGHIDSANLPKLICVFGPTGTGKSGLALYLARHFNGAIINLDSRQVYLSLPIITAQPDEHSKIQCPHFLYGFLPCTQKISAGIYADLAHEAIALCIKLGLQPILVGGTGLYAQTLLQGIAPIPQVPKLVQDYWQMRYQRAGSRTLHAELTAFDPAYAAKISPNDKQRVIRALSVYSATGRPLSWWHKATQENTPERTYSTLKIGLKAPLDELKPRLAKRIEQMLHCGGLEEIKRATKIYGPSGHMPKPVQNLPNEHASSRDETPGLSSIGCTEILDYLAGKTNLAQCCELWLNSTRAYAKRQLTWFNKDKGASGINWFDLSENNIQDRTKTLVNQFLNSEC